MNFLDYTFFNSWEQFLIVGLIILISQIIYSTIGFGSGMFAISILALLYGKLGFFVPFFVFLCLPTEIYITWKDRKLINLKSQWKFLITIFPFLALGSFLLTKSESPIVLIVLGVVIFSLALYHLFWEEKIIFSLKSGFWIPFFGSLSGIMGGLFGMAGPPLIFYYKNQNLTKSNFRVALLSIFALMTLMRILFYLKLDLFKMEILLSSASVVPLAILGMILGNIFHKSIPEELFKNITSAALGLSGILIIIKNLISLVTTQS